MTHAAGGVRAGSPRDGDSRAGRRGMSRSVPGWGHTLWAEGTRAQGVSVGERLFPALRRGGGGLRALRTCPELLSHSQTIHGLFAE